MVSAPWPRSASGALLVATMVVFGTAVPVAQAASTSGWTIVSGATTVPGSSNFLFGTTCATAWDCWAAGVTIDNINSQHSQPTALLEHWDGTAWTVDPSAAPRGPKFSALWDVTCVNPSDCWAVGAQGTSGGGTPVPLFERWDGSNWSVVASPPAHGELFSVTCVSATDCWATGVNVTNDSNADPLDGFIDHWNGSSWTLAPTAPSGQAHDQFNSVTCSTASDCWAVGFAGPNALSDNFLPNIMPQVSGGQAFVEHWNGDDWSVVPAATAPAPEGTYLSSVTCTSASNCWAVGSVMGADGNPASTLVDRWDGSRWSTVPSADPSAAGQELTDVTCLGAADCWATGAASESSGNLLNSGTSPLIEAWNGSGWSVESSPDVTAFGYLNGVGCTRVGGCFAVGFALTSLGNNDTTFATLTEQLVLPQAGQQGLLLSGVDGGVFAFGNASFHGSLGALHLNAPIVGLAATPGGAGYWEVGADGGVFAFGNARFHGSLGAAHLNAPIVGMASTPDGAGYWLVAADGGIFAFGDASFHGSLGALHLNAPIVGMAATPDGNGYWLVAADGGVFSFGDADFDGSMGGTPMSQPIVGMAAAPDGSGYWLVAADGGVFTFGDAGFYGSLPGQGVVAPSPVDAIAATPDGQGYWLVGRDGAVSSYGDANFLGSLVGTGLSAPIVGATAGP